MSQALAVPHFDFDLNLQYLGLISDLGEMYHLDLFLRYEFIFDAGVFCKIVSKLYHVARRRSFRHM